MFNFSIMPLLPDRIKELCDDVEYQVRAGIATMPLFSVTLTPEGDPAIDKAQMLCERYEKYKAELDRRNIPSGILMQATIGHGWKLNQPSSFQKFVGLSDGSTPEVCCPYDEDFRAYIRAAAARIARTRPAHIMLDDDFRLMSWRPGGGCACPLHLKAVSRIIGKEIGREELYRKINEGTEESKALREAFISTQLDSLIGCAREIRRGIDSEDPSIPGSFCLCGESAEAAYEVATIMAGEGNPIVLRTNNANYCTTDSRDLVRSFHIAAVQMAALSGKPDAVLAETDTCPQNRYSASAQRLHAHFTFSLLEGMKGAKHWITRMIAYEPKSGVAYRKKLAANRGFYEEISRIVPELVWQGCKIPIPQRPTYPVGKGGIAGTITSNNGWVSHVLDRFGIPLHFSPKGEGVYYFDGAIDEHFTDEEIREFLSGKLVADAQSAKRLVARGFGNELGVEVKERKPTDKNASAERYPSGAISKAPYKTHELVPLSENTKQLSEVYHLRDGKYTEPLYPGATLFKNDLGGTAAVFSGVTDFPYDLVNAFGFLCEARKNQLIELMQSLGELPVCYPDDAEVFMKAAKTKDGRLFCALLNLGLDPIESLPLLTESRLISAERLAPDGSYTPVGFKAEGNRNELEITATPYEPVVLMLCI